MDDNLLKARSPCIHLNAALCLLADLLLSEARDYVVAQLDDFVFQMSREKRFILDILYCVQETDPDLLMDHIWNYDFVVKLTARQLTMLQIVYEAVKASKPPEVKPKTLEEQMQERVQAEVDRAASDSGSSWGSDTESGASSDEEAPRAGAGGPASPTQATGRRGSVMSASMASSVHS